MKNTIQFNKVSKKLRTRLVFASISLLVLIILTACGSVTTPQLSTPGEAEDQGRYDYTLSVDITSDDQQADIENLYGGNTILWRPEAGFAILGLYTDNMSEFSLLSGAEANQGVIQAPEVAANAEGNDSWAGGFDSWAGGFDSWAGGFDAWGGGFDAWGGGFDAWGGGFDAWGGAFEAVTFDENLTVWDQVNLSQGQRLAPNLGQGVKIAVIDTGIALDHPAFEDCLAPQDEWSDLIGPYSNYPNDAWTSGGENKGYGHGTAVAGMILQMAPQATILPIRVLDSEGIGDTDDIVVAIDWAIQNGADIINLSIGTDVEVGALSTMLDYAASQGIFIVTSAGNENSTNITFPAKKAKQNDNLGKHLISVGSVNASDKKSPFSNYGSDLELVAPGEGIYSFSPYRETNGPATGGYGMNYVNGTSFAAPLVSGAIALALGESPSSSLRASINDLLMSTATPVDQANPGHAGQLGAGRLDVEAFLAGMGFSPLAPFKSALYVLNTSNSKSAAGDAPFIARLELYGFAVTVKDDGVVTAADADGFDLVVISSSVSSGTMSGKMRDVAVPVVTWEEGIYDDMGLTTDRGSSSGTQIRIQDANHPLAVGFTGDVSVFEASNDLVWGKPSSGATIVASLSNDASLATVFAYEAGSQMSGLTAPARRVGLFHNYYNAPHTSEGWVFFDAAVIWASLGETSSEAPSPEEPSSGVTQLSAQTYLEAEASTALEGNFVSQADNSVSGAAYMLILEGSGSDYGGTEGSNTTRLHFDVQASASDTYYVWLRVYGADNGSDSFFISMDNATKHALHFQQTNSWLWKKLDASFVLSDSHRLTISLREDGAQIDRILLTTDAGFTPSGLGGN